MPESFWIEIRSHYFAMSELLHFIDTKVSWIVILACTNNLYFICAQFFNSFQSVFQLRNFSYLLILYMNREFPYLLNRVYFWYSFGFVLVRTLVMLFCAASVHDASRTPLTILRGVPSKAYSVEVGIQK